MIDFACKQFRMEDVVKCSLALSKADFNTMMFFMKGQDWRTTEDIALRQKCNLSTAQRSVKKLFEKGILERRQENLDGGGYTYLYKLKSKEDIRKIILTLVNAWVSKVELELKKW